MSREIINVQLNSSLNQTDGHTREHSDYILYFHKLMPGWGFELESLGRERYLLQCKPATLPTALRQRYLSTGVKLAYVSKIQYGQ